MTCNPPVPAIDWYTPGSMPPPVERAGPTLADLWQTYVNSRNRAGSADATEADFQQTADLYWALKRVAARFARTQPYDRLIRCGPTEALAYCRANDSFAVMETVNAGNILLDASEVPADLDESGVA